MAHDVFISHSSKDKPTADAVCAVLEAQGIRCWVAPRDILPGKNWGGSIVEAIKGAKAMVLIFSTHANSSEHITREVERAANRGIPIIPVRIENILPTDSLEYFLSSPHWLDAFPPPLDNHLQHLAQVVRQIVGVAPPPEPPPVPSAPVVVAPKKTEPGKPAPAETSSLPAPAVGAVAPERTEAPEAAPVQSDRSNDARLATDERLSRILITVGSIAMMVGAVNPLDGSLVVLLGSGLVALGTFRGPSERWLVKYRVWVFILIGMGTGQLWRVHALDLGLYELSIWWWVLILPYPIGWYMGVWGPGAPRWLLRLGIVVGLLYLALAVVAVLPSPAAVGFVRFWAIYASPLFSDWLLHVPFIFLAAIGVLTIGGSIIRLWKRTPARK